MNKEAAQKAGIPEEEWKYLIFDFGNYTQVCPHEPEFSEMLNKYFVIEQTWQDTSHPAFEFKRDYVMRKV